jgi:hypothetical protein
MSDSPISRLANSTPAVQNAFLTAGVTIATITAIQSIAIVATWIFFGGT